MTTENTQMRVTEDVSPEAKLLEISGTGAQPVNPAAPSATQRRSRGRPPGSKTGSGSRRAAARVRVNGGAPQSVPVEPQKTPEQIQAEIVAEASQYAPLLKETIGMFVDPLLPPEKPYSEEHALGLACAIVPVAQKHAGTVGPYAAEIALGLVVVSQGLMIYREIQAHKAAQQRQLPAE
jgi:hypothetical protein